MFGLPNTLSIVSRPGDNPFSRPVSAAMLSSVWSGHGKGMLGKETDARRSSQWSLSEGGPAGAIASTPIPPIPRPSVMGDDALSPFGQAVQDVGQDSVRFLFAGQ